MGLSGGLATNGISGGSGSSQPVVNSAQYNVKDYGAKGDTKYVSDVVVTASATVTSASAPFVSTDAGKSVYLVGGGAAVTATGTTNTTTTPTAYTANQVTGMSSTAGIFLGMLVQGAGIAAGTFVDAVAGTTVYLSRDATAVGAGVTLTFLPILKTTISAYNSATSVTLANAASTAITGTTTMVYGTDDTAAVNATVTAASATGGVVYFQRSLGRYMISSKISVPASVDVMGQDRFSSQIEWVAQTNAGQVVFEWAGTIGAAVTLTANAVPSFAQNSSNPVDSLTITSTTGINPNDYLLVYNNVPTGATSGSVRGEAVQVQTVDSGTGVTLYERIVDGTYYAGNGQTGTTSAGLTTGGAITTIPVNALGGAIPAGAVVVVSGSNQQVFVTAGAAGGATTIPVTSQVPAFAFPSGSAVRSVTTNIRRMGPVQDPTITDIGFTCHLNPLTSSDTIGPVRFLYTSGARAERIFAEHFGQYVICFESSVHYGAHDIELRDMFYSHNTSGLASYGYGILLRGTTCWGQLSQIDGHNCQVFNEGGDQYGFPRFCHVQAIVRGQAGVTQRWPVVNTKAALSLHDDSDRMTFDIDVEDWNDLGFLVKGSNHFINARIENAIGAGIFLSAQNATTYPTNCTILARVQEIAQAPDNSLSGNGIQVQGTGHVIHALDLRDLDGYGIRIKDGGFGEPNSGHVVYADAVSNWGRTDNSVSAVHLGHGVVYVTNTDVRIAHGVNAAAGTRQVVKFDGGTLHTGCTIQSGGVSKGASFLGNLLGTGEAWAVVDPQGGAAALAYSASITPTLARWQTITVANATAFTVTAPPAPSASQTQELVIEVLNSSGGVMGAITWNAAFVFAGQTWTNPASTKKRFARFEWNGANWVCTGVATADY